MAHIIFYEKPGCINNTKQKAWLEAAGHTVEAVNLLEHPWQADELRTFMDGDDPAAWFNRTAPVIKEGRLNPDNFEAHEALAAMVVTPILIKRPLMQVENEKMQGFNTEQVSKWIGLAPLPGNEELVASLSADDLTFCPQLDSTCA